MSRSKRWDWQDTRNGIATVKLLSWKYFLDFTYQKMLDYETYVYRGQRNEHWGLGTTLDRLIKTAKIAKTKQFDFRSSHLQQFKYAARGRRGINPPELTENEWWALGQHHGLATPLLDWTQSPFVAAYFAFINDGEPQTKYRVVYALHKPSIEAKVAANKAAREADNRQQKADIAAGRKVGNLLLNAFLDYPVQPEIEFVRPFSDENQRLVNQGGLFTKSPSGKNIEEWVAEQFVGENSCILMRILIPNSDRAYCLRYLNRMNINHLTLFPDLYGASKFCNLYGEIEKY